MALNNKNKSRIPISSRSDQEDGEENQHIIKTNPLSDATATRNNAASVEADQPTKVVNKSQSQRKMLSKSNPAPPPQPSSHHPLSKAMQKKPQKKGTQQSSESWAEEKVESVSQKIRGQSKADHEKRKQEMASQLREAEEQLVVMTELLDKREKLLQEMQEDAEKTQSALGEKIADQEEKLIVNGVDPVTGEKIVLGEEDKQKMESTKKFTKKRIQQMREKLRQMSEKTESYLTDIENTVQYLGSLEDASERAGPISEETQKIVDETGSDDFIAKVYAENVPPKNQDDEADSEDDGGDERQSPSGRDSPEDENKDEKEEEDTEDSAASKFFITSREGETETEGAENVVEGEEENVKPENS